MTNNTINLRAHQSRSITQIMYALNSGVKKNLLRIPTGGGKSYTAAQLIRNYLDEGRRAMFIVDRLALLDQMLKTFDQFGIYPGVIQGNHPMTDYSNPVQLVSVDSLPRRIDSVRKPHLVIQDECHEVKSVISWMMEEWDSDFVGMTATPFSRGLGLHWQQQIVGAKYQELLDEGILCPYRVWSPERPIEKPDLMKSGEYQAKSAQEILCATKIADNVLECYFSKARGKSALYCTPSVATSKWYKDIFKAEGVIAEEVNGYAKTDYERDKDRELVEAFKAGQIEVVFQVQKLTVGFDYPGLEVLGMLDPTNSLIKFLQACGRVVRTCEGKEEGLILDHVGNFQNDLLCRPEEVDLLPLALDETKKKTILKIPKEERDRHCPDCKEIMKPRQFECTCGWSPPEIKTKMEWDVTNKLIELTSTQRKNFNEVDASRFWQSLKWYFLRDREKEKLRDGWASDQFKKRFGVNVREYQDIYQLPQRTPDEDARKWYRALMIRKSYAKRKFRGAA